MSIFDRFFFCLRGCGVCCFSSVVGVGLGPLALPPGRELSSFSFFFWYIVLPPQNPFPPEQTNHIILQISRESYPKKKTTHPPTPHTRSFVPCPPLPSLLNSFSFWNPPLSTHFTKPFRQPPLFCFSPWKGGLWVLFINTSEERCQKTGGGGLSFPSPSLFVGWGYNFLISVPPAFILFV